MSTKNTILQSLISHMKLINGSTHNVPSCPFSPYTYKNNVFGNVTDQFKFLENINDFPTVTFFQTSPEQRFERGGGEVYATVNYVVRCYFLSSDHDEQADDFIEDLQFSINSFKYTQTSGDLVDVRILAVSSDEKILEPYGIAELSLALVYRLTI
jgi:hypothetical protein